MVIFRVFTVLVSALIFTCFSGCKTMEYRAYLPMYFDMSSESNVIPDGYDSYTLFFVTSYSYPDSLGVHEIKRLNRRLKEFGKNIGKNNLVVWVGDSSKNKLSVELGKTYADKFAKWYGSKMSYTDGPYIVYISHRPNSQPTDKDFMAYITFANKKPKYIEEFIDYIEASIRRKEISRLGLKSKAGWIGLKSFWDNHSNDIFQLTGILINVISRH